jgi:hypothetical protein
MSQIIHFFEEIKKNITECYDKDPKYTISMRYNGYEKYTAFLKTFEANVYYDIFLIGKNRNIYITTLGDENDVKDAVLDTITFYTKNIGNRSFERVV